METIFVDEQKLSRFLSDADDAFSFVDCSGLDIRQALRVKRRRITVRCAATVLVIVFTLFVWRTQGSHDPNTIRPVLTERTPVASVPPASESQDVSVQLAALREALAEERKKMDNLNRTVASWNNLDVNVAESTSLVDVSYAFHLQNNVGETDLAMEEFERITRDSPGTRGARIAADSLVAFRHSP